MSKRRNCSFNEDLQKEFKFITLYKLCSDERKVVCQHCNVHFSVAHGGRSDIKQHLRSQKHKDAEKTMASVKNISSFMVRRDGDSESDKIAASEALVIIPCVTAKVSAQMTAC
jgi:glutaredoxin-related protein